MKNTTYTFYIGLNDQYTKKQEIWTIEAFKLATRITIDYFGWWTISEADWIYTHDNGEIVIEKTLRIEVLTTENVNKYIEDLKKTFNQESILVKKAVEDCDFL